MKVSEVMSKPTCVTTGEATLGEAATLMGEQRVGSALVLDGERLVGILTERDVVRALSQAFDAPMRPVQEWMTKDPVATGSGADASEALQQMLDGGFRHLPVVDDGYVVGVLSIRDLAAAGRA